jgi:hypothetical protein
MDISLCVTPEIADHRAICTTPGTGFDLAPDFCSGGNCDKELTVKR